MPKLEIWELHEGETTHWFARNGEITMTVSAHKQGESAPDVPADITPIELLTDGWQPCMDEAAYLMVMKLFQQATGIDFEAITKGEA